MLRAKIGDNGSTIYPSIETHLQNGDEQINQPLSLWLERRKERHNISPHKTINKIRVRSRDQSDIWIVETHVSRAIMLALMSASRVKWRVGTITSCKTYAGAVAVVVRSFCKDTFDLSVRKTTSNYDHWYNVKSFYRKGNTLISWGQRTKGEMNHVLTTPIASRRCPLIRHQTASDGSDLISE